MSVKILFNETECNLLQCGTLQGPSINYPEIPHIVIYDVTDLAESLKRREAINKLQWQSDDSIEQRSELG